MTTTTPKSGKFVPECEGGSPLAGPGPGGHKQSFKSTKLARRARSFKDDFLEKISQIRSPTNQAVRSHSPKSSSAHHVRTISKGTGGDEDGSGGGGSIMDVHSTQHPTKDKGPMHEFENLSKQIQVTLKHLKDVVAKKKLEMLPGNGTIVLDTVWAINLLVKSSVCPEQSSSIRSATHRMYQSVARLIKLCDDALIDSNSNVLEEKNVIEVVTLVEDAVQNLMKLSQEKLNAQQSIMYKTAPRSSYANVGAMDMSSPSQRNSLPDIPLTPRERQILEQTSGTPMMVRNSLSSESILHDTIPPPKPPLPDSIFFNRGDVVSLTPPPLPPKKRINKSTPNDDSLYLDRMSLRSRSPEDSSSLLSASAGSLDSMLNQSREEEEITALMDHNDSDALLLDNDLSEISSTGGNNCWEENQSITLINTSNEILQYNRLSNTDSGIVSMHSQRNSSCSKRSSQQSTTTQWTSNHNHQQQQSQQISIKTECSSSSSSSLFMQKNSSGSLLMMAGSNGTTHDEVDCVISGELPPAIPQKTRRKIDRQPSPYDNVPECHMGGEVLVTCQMHQSQQSLSTSTSVSSTMSQDANKPPPLPPKKKHIMAYMEMFGNCSHSNDQEFMRHSVHMVHGAWNAATTTPSPGLPTTQSCSFTTTQQSSSVSMNHHHAHTHLHSLSLPHDAINITTTSNSNSISPLSSPLKLQQQQQQQHLPPALPPKRRTTPLPSPQAPQHHIVSNAVLARVPATTTTTTTTSAVIDPPLPDLLEHHHTPTNQKSSSSVVEQQVPAHDDAKQQRIDGEVNVVVGDGDDEVLDLIEELDVSKYLVMKKAEEDGPEIRGGTIDALIIQATKGTRNVFTYQEAFLTTYRTFVTPYDLICKLIRRYNYFYCQPEKKARSREAFALLVRVVNDLTVADLDEKLQQKLMDFVQQLIIGGELTLAKALRVKHIEKHNAKELVQRYYNVPPTTILSSRNYTLLDFKSEQIAEQMTLLDAELFMKIEIPEVLIWAQEQNEERSPNLTRFTEHFNKMSYWARTRILLADAKDREKYFLKFIKIMKHLRKINNFNSYLALLSALDSAPIRRLEWQKHVQEGLKEYCALIDSSSSFRAYRQALAETQPPCIPYIGLVLQDLTFVHIGNSNVITDNIINFSKRWQQFNIVENMKRFKKCLSSSSSTYTFSKNERIIAFFQNFDDFIHEDAMWQISENIKPRGGKKATTQQ